MKHHFGTAKYVLLLILLATPISVADTTSEKYKAVIYIYRTPVVFMIKRSSPVVIFSNRTPIGKLENGKYYKLVKTAGPLTIETGINEKEPSDVISFFVEDGKEYFCRVKAHPGGKTSIELVFSYIGRPELYSCRLAEEVRQDDELPSVVQKDSTEAVEVIEEKQKEIIAAPSSNSSAKTEIAAATKKEPILPSLSSEIVQSNLPVITILDFRVDNMPISDAKLIVDLLFHSLVSLRKYTVIDRNKRDEVLNEIEFSNRNCADEKCQLQIGKLLSADLIIIGSIGHISNRYLINTKLLKVETSEALSTASEIYKNLDELVDNCQKVIIELSN